MSIWTIFTGNTGHDSLPNTGHSFGTRAKADPKTVTVSRTGGLFGLKTPEATKEAASDIKPWWK